ncbi:MAG: CXXX repeat peptide modification system protein [Clostridium sp.]|uniref:CXXX repeat peptide modification system protein n=1 Tax=Clostridium sp. TaxID=1506 RepID=UPI003024B2CF
MKVLGIIDEVDNSELEIYEERKNSLNELKRILDKDLQKDMIKDLEKNLLNVESNIDNWWNRVINKYDLTIDSDCEVNVEFSTREITLRNSR